jgi:hypothetical protein
VKRAERAQVLRDGINQMKATTHALLEAELFAAADELARTVMTLEKQWEVFVVEEGALIEASRQ